MISILAVCTGNVCRSPLAASILSARLSSFDVAVSSAGTAARPGVQMTAEAKALATLRGADPVAVEQHRSRMLTVELAANADLVLVMTRDQRRQVAELAPSAVRRTLTAREFARLSAALLAGTTRLVASSPPNSDDARSLFSQALAMLTSLRGIVSPPVSGSEDDVVDPFGRSTSTYARSAAELDPGLDAVVEFVEKVLDRSRVAGN